MEWRQMKQINSRLGLELPSLWVMGRSPSIAGRVSFQLIQSISISLPLIPSPSIQQLAERENKQAVHQLFIFLFQFKSLSTHFILIQFKLFLFIDWLIWKEKRKLNEFGLGEKTITFHSVIKRFSIFYEGSRTNKSINFPFLFIPFKKIKVSFFVWLVSEQRKYYNSKLIILKIL